MKSVLLIISALVFTNYACASLMQLSHKEEGRINQVFDKQVQHQPTISLDTILTTIMANLHKQNQELRLVNSITSSLGLAATTGFGIVNLCGEENENSSKTKCWLGFAALFNFGLNLLIKDAQREQRSKIEATKSYVTILWRNHQKTLNQTPCGSCTQKQQITDVFAALTPLTERIVRLEMSLKKQQPHLKITPQTTGAAVELHDEIDDEIGEHDTNKEFPHNNQLRTTRSTDSVTSTDSGL